MIFKIFGKVHSIISNIISIAVAIVLIVAYSISFSYPNMIETLYSNGLYPLISSVFVFLFGWIPFSVGEIIVYLFAVYIVYLIISCIISLVKLRPSFFRRVGKLLLKLVAACLTIVTLFILLWGFNYARLPLASSLELDTKPRSTEELYEVCKYLANETNSSYTQNYLPKETMNKLVADEYEKTFNRKLGQIKPVLASKILCYSNISGVFSFFTGESNINSDIPVQSYPYTAMHELAHQLGYAREDEANFLAYYTSCNSDNSGVKYSSNLNALVYATNALYSENKDLYYEIKDMYSEEVTADLKEISNFWSQYEGEIGEAVEAMNNSYLKANGLSDGVKSYGRMVDLLIAYIYPKLG